MYRMHPDFELPERDSIIWRYLTLDKFTDLLESQEVFFARADVLQDQREGVWSVAEMHDLLESRGARESQFGDLIGMTERISAEVCKTVALNCWCIGEDVHVHMWQNRLEPISESVSATESPGRGMHSLGLWKRYLEGSDGVAIVTTVSDLMDAFDRETVQPVYIGEVKYIDYDNDLMHARTNLAPFLFKDRQFEDERELRAVTTRQIGSLDLNSNVAGPGYYPGAAIEGGGIRIPVHLDKLIKHIQIAPFASHQCVELVRRYCSEFLGIV